MVFISMRITLLIILSILLTGCAMNKKATSDGHYNGKELTDVEKDGLPDIVDIEPDRIIVNDEAGYAYEEAYMVESLESNGVMVTTNEPLVIREVENNKTTSTTNNGGHVAYKIPNEMTVRSTYQVVVRISKSTVNIYENLNGEVTTTTVPLTQTMEVKLIDSSPSDNKMFDIVENNKGVQLVEDNEAYTQWTWDITPLRAGTSKLKIVISIIKNRISKETVYEDEVVVKTDVTKTVPFFIATYWQWIMSSIIIPFVIWFFNKRRKKKEEE